MSPEWDGRYFSFDSHWAPDEDMASMRNGSGDEWSIVFASAGVFVRGFDHESDMSPYVNNGRLWPGLVESVPAVFADHVTEPAFSDGATLLATVCLWRQTEDDGWHAGDIAFPSGDDPDGANWLFAMLVDYSPEAYERFVEDYYESQVDSSAVRAVFALEPLTQELVQRLNPETDMAALADDLDQIGYRRCG
ncbi:Uncharacterised protein [Cellulomonas fimi]|nr:Uncharacterised protein [Cellulomonas fimi]